jgi:hypothetical protein
MLSEITERQIPCVLTYMWILRQTHRNRVKWWPPEAWGGGMESGQSKGTKPWSDRRNKFDVFSDLWHSMVNIADDCILYILLLPIESIPNVLITKRC